MERTGGSLLLIGGLILFAVGVIIGFISINNSVTLLVIGPLLVARIFLGILGTYNIVIAPYNNIKRDYGSKQ